ATARGLFAQAPGPLLCCGPSAGVGHVLSLPRSIYGPNDPELVQHHQAHQVADRWGYGRRRRPDARAVRGLVLRAVRARTAPLSAGSELGMNHSIPRAQLARWMLERGVPAQDVCDLLVSTAGLAGPTDVLEQLTRDPLARRRASS